MNKSEMLISVDQSVADAMLTLRRIGFVEYIPGGENVPSGFEADFDEYIERYNVIMLEADMSRNMICVILMYHDYKVFVMNDVGCGWVEMPFRWSEVSEESIAALKLAFTGQIVGRLIP